MVFKVILAAAVLATVCALPKHAPVHHHDYDHHEHHGHATSSQSLKQHHDEHGHPKYEFAYEVKDPHTHDIKEQHEHRDGDIVTGAYSLLQPDGRIRHVKYYVDGKSGFHADVKYEDHAKHVPEHQYEYHH